MALLGRVSGCALVALSTVVCGCAGAELRDGAASQADGTSLPVTDRIAIAAGHGVSRPLEFEKAGAKYVGGVSYQLVHATPGEVIEALTDPESLVDMLPRTKRVDAVDATAKSTRLEVTQGNDLVEATYTVRIEAEGDTVRFWLDDTRPHDIDDVWGYFRVRPFDSERSLVTVGVALDMGPGIARLLFEDAVQRLILSTPQTMRQALEQRAQLDRRQASLTR